MKFGLVTDIHNDATRLRRALQLLMPSEVTSDVSGPLGTPCRADRIITIGDTFDPLAQADGMAEVAELLIECNAVGVWGNHDYVFCQETPAEYYQRYPAVVFQCLKRIGSSLVQCDTDMGDLHFSHREHYVDPFDPVALWDLTGEEINISQRAQQALANTSFAVQFVGHYHCWLAYDRYGKIDWDGQEPLHFQGGERYYVAVAAICDGWCAMLDDEKGVLVPIRL